MVSLDTTVSHGNKKDNLPKLTTQD